jgi:flagellar basal-body rod modification protein FlgD
MATSDTSALGGINQQQLLQLLIAGLQNQDPMQPMDNQQFLQQLTEFANLQGVQNLNARFADMLQLQQLTNGSSLIGKTVSYQSGDTLKAGPVSGLLVRDGNIYLAIGSDQVTLDQIQSVAGN